MKKTAVFLMIMICATAVFSQNSGAQTKEKIAVYVTGNVGTDEKKALGTKILVELINSGRYRAVERSDDFVRELDREQSKQMSGAVDNSQITTIGKQFGVQIICVADLTPAFGSYVISARLIEVESAEIVAIADVSNALESMDDLTAASKDVVRVILGGKAKRRLKSSSASKREVVTVESGGSTQVFTVDRKRSIGARAAFGSAMNFDLQLTTISRTVASNGRRTPGGYRGDLMLGYCGGFRSDYYPVYSNYGYYSGSTITRDSTTESYSAFELVSAMGWPIGNADYHPLTGYLSFACALYIGSGVSDVLDMGLGAQMGLEYSTEDVVFGIDFRPMYYFLSAIFSEAESVATGAPGFRFTIGLSIRYRL
jgi:hypothetical protein